jgi:putative Mg2+ transporter-C (MgtC) family protein
VLSSIYTIFAHRLRLYDMTTEFILRLFIAALLGGIIGFEREYRAKEAGARTHFLVALGSALFMIISQYGFDVVLGQLDKASFDPSRIASQVVTGIGFIGAGTIIFQKHVVRGLTTAAGLWVTSAIGLTCGAGLYPLAVAATILVLICLETLNMAIKKYGTRNLVITFATADKEEIPKLLEQMKAEFIDVDSYSMQESKDGDSKNFHVTVEVKVRRSHYQDRLLTMMKQFDGITFEEIE